MEILAGSGYINSMDKHPKRPRDPSQLAKMIVDIATNEEKASPTPKTKGSVKKTLEDEAEQASD